MKHNELLDILRPFSYLINNKLNKKKYIATLLFETNSAYVLDELVTTNIHAYITLDNIINPFELVDIINAIMPFMKKEFNSAGHLTNIYDDTYNNSSSKIIVFQLFNNSLFKHEYFKKCKTEYDNINNSTRTIAKYNL